MGTVPEQRHPVQERFVITCDSVGEIDGLLARAHADGWELQSAIRRTACIDLLFERA